jgi:hypothetical protein
MTKTILFFRLIDKLLFMRLTAEQINLIKKAANHALGVPSRI